MSNDQPHRDLGRDRPDDDLIAAVAASPELVRVAFLLAAQPTQRELTGLEGTLREFRSHVSTPQQKRRRPSMISTLAGAKLGATIAGLAVGLGGAATVAYVSANAPATPETHATAAASPTQRATPTQAATGSDADKSEQAKGEAVGPDATGSAGFGLCTAWKGVAQNGKAMEAVAFQNLIKAAGGEEKVEAFCANVDAPGKSEDRATGKPAETGKPDTIRTGKPADAPTGKPETAPTVPDARPDTTPTAPTSHPTGRS
jgi:hypothetical protein